jgi:hypothetical protein
MQQAATTPVAHRICHVMMEPVYHWLHESIGKLV